MNSELGFRIAFTLAFLINIAVVFMQRLRAQRAGDRAGDRLDRGKEGALLLLRLSGLALWLAWFAYIINPEWLAWAHLGLPGWLRWAAAALALIALPPFAFWTMRAIGTNITDTVDIRTQHRLVTSGPYRWMRHPFYTLTFSLSIALGVLAANWLMLGLTAVVMIYIVLRLPKEEAMLIERFGDEYRQYMKHTGRFLPGW